MHESEKWKWIRSVVSDSLRPHRLQPTRLLRPWDFPGKSTGVGCHCLLRFWSWLVLKHSGTFLEGADQNLPITEHFPDPCQPPISLSLSFFTTLKSLDFPQLCCVFPSFPVCILFYYILFRAVSLLKKNMLSESERYIWTNISQVNDSPISYSCQVNHHWREWIE